MSFTSKRKKISNNQIYISIRNSNRRRIQLQNPRRIPRTSDFNKETIILRKHRNDLQFVRFLTFDDTTKAILRNMKFLFDKSGNYSLQEEKKLVLRERDLISNEPVIELLLLVLTNLFISREKQLWVSTDQRFIFVF